jgi:hypothetical protein
MAREERYHQPDVATAGHDGDGIEGGFDPGKSMIRGLSR